MSDLTDMRDHARKMADWEPKPRPLWQLSDIVEDEGPDLFGGVA